MKSKKVQRLLRALIALVGAGIGAAVAAGVLQAIAFATPGYRVPVRALAIIYTSTCAVGGLIFLLLSNRILQRCVDWGNRLEQRMDKMPFSQMMGCVWGLICGLIIAALTSQILNFVGTSLFTTAISAILYVVFATLGLSIGYKRAADFAEMQERFTGFRERRAQRKIAKRSREAEEEDETEAVLAPHPKLLDTSVLIDGRIFDVIRAGFLEGELVVPQFVLDELRRIADSADPLRRNRGRRGLELLQKAQQSADIPLRIDGTDWPDETDADVKLLRLATELNGLVVTNDYNLNKVAALSGMKVLNLNDLAGALKPAVIAGEELALSITKEGKEPNQGVGYLDDGTMIVVEGGRAHVGQTVTVIVTSVLQTSAGRMIFSKMK